MLTAIIAIVWFAHRAEQANRNIIGWSFVGLLVFAALKVLVTLIAINADVSSVQQSKQMLVLLNILLYGGIFGIGLFIKPTQISKEEEDNEEDIIPPESKALLDREKRIHKHLQKKLNREPTEKEIEKAKWGGLEL